MESLNNIFKDYKYTSNFEYTRNIILWATKKNLSILGVPKILPKTNKNKRKQKKVNSHYKGKRLIVLPQL